MNQPAARRGSVAWALVITSVAGFMAALDNLVVTTALPSIREDLGGALHDLEWTVSAYTLTFAVLLMFGAALGDRFGRRRLFIVGLTVFTGASAAAGLAPGIDALIAARAVQGVGAAIMMPLTLTLLTAAVPAAKRGMAFGIWGAVQGLAVASGPLIGGTLTEHISWQWIFWLNVPLGLALLPLARLRLAESHGTGARLDIAGDAPRQRRPVRHRLRADPRPDRRLDLPDRPHRTDQQAPRSSAGSSTTASTARRRCCPCGSSATAPSPGSTRPAC